MVSRRCLQIVFLTLVIGAVFAARAGRGISPTHQPVLTPAASLPVMFEPDRNGLSFTVRARGYTMRIAPAGAATLLRGGEDDRTVELGFVGGGGRVVADRPLATTVNYLRGPREAWRTSVQTFGAARIDQLYDGIDAHFYGAGGDVEYDLIVAPGRDVSRIRMRFSGADAIALVRGELKIRAGSHTLTHKRPVAHQTIAGRRQTVDVRYQIAADGAVGFVSGAYDRGEPLVIDPVISYSTYFGATGSDRIQTLATDAAGNLYMGGSSHAGDFPPPTIRPHAPVTTNPPESDAYLAKLRPDGTAEWITFMGGTADDGIGALAIGSNGDAYLTGFTRSVDFPTTPGAYYTTPSSGNQDTFVVRLSPNGTMQWGTLLGAPQPWGGAGGRGIAVDPQGRPIVVGATASPWFEPTIQSSFGPQRPNLDQPDGFIARFSADGSRIEFSRLLAGSYMDFAHAVALDQGGNSYVVGRTTSTDYPVVNAIRATKYGPGDPDGLGNWDGFLTMVWDNGTIGFSTYLGGSGEDSMDAVAVGLYDRVYVGGTTNSADASTYSPAPAGQDFGIMYHIIPKSTGLLQARPVGGNGRTELTSLSVGKDWSIWATGFTSARDFTINGPDDPAPQPTHAGGLDVFVQKWGPDLNSLSYSYLLGGTGDDQASAVTLDPLGDIYVGGSTASGDYPVKHAVQPAKKGPGASLDGFITKLACYLRGFVPDVQPASGGEGSFWVYAVEGCVVQAVSDSPWLRITGVVDGRVYFTTDPNPTPAERQALVTVSGKQITPVTQAAGAGGSGPSSEEIVLNASDVDGFNGEWYLVTDDVHGTILKQPDRGMPKIETPAAFPHNWFSFDFFAEAGKPYHLWLHGRAQGDSWRNDSIYAQFSDSVDASGDPVYRIGTTSATWVSLEECSGCGVQAWGWQDNRYGARGDLGSDIYFATTGMHRIMFQSREDGFDIGQVVLSARAYLRTAPGAAMNDPTIVTTGSPPPPPPPPPPSVDEIVLWAGADAAAGNGTWRPVSDPSAAGQAALWNPDAGVPKLGSPLASPQNFIELTFNADAGKPYHLWLRMKADNDYWTNDSVWVQFSGSVDASGNAVSRIGTTSGTWVSLEECSGCGEQGWGWQDNAYGSPGNLGPPIYFATSAPQTIRIQTREDGVRIDQIVLSAVRYATSAPGANRNDTTILPRTPK